MFESPRVALKVPTCNARLSIQSPNFLSYRLLGTIAGSKPRLSPHPDEPLLRFIDGATRLRGMARSLDVAQVITGIRKLELKIEERAGERERKATSSAKLHTWTFRFPPLLGNVWKYRQYRSLLYTFRGNKGRNDGRGVCAPRSPRWRFGWSLSPEFNHDTTGDKEGRFLSQPLIRPEACATSKRFSQCP